MWNHRYGGSGGGYTSLCHMRIFKCVKGWCPPSIHTLFKVQLYFYDWCMYLWTVSNGKLDFKQEKENSDVLFFVFGGLHHTACGILVPNQGWTLHPATLHSVEAQSLTHWTPREVPDVFKTRLWSVEGGLVSALAAAEQVTKRGRDNCLSWRNCCHGEKRGSLRGDHRGKQETSSRREATVWGSLCQGRGGAWRAVRPVAAPGQLAGSREGWDRLTRTQSTERSMPRWSGRGETFLVVQQLRRHVPNTDSPGWGPGSIPGQGARPHLRRLRPDRAK